MRYIKLFENFDKIQSEVNKIENDIRGILVDLEDNGFVIYIDVEKNFFNNHIPMHVDIKVSKRVNFKYSEISEYIFTLIDYMNYIWKSAAKANAIIKGFDSNKLVLRSGYLMRSPSYNNIPNDKDVEMCDFSIIFTNRLNMQHHDT